MTKEQRLQEIFESIDRPFLVTQGYPRSLFFFRGNDYIFSYNTTFKYLFCSEERIWRIFMYEYGMDLFEIQSLIKDQVENVFKLKGVTPLQAYSFHPVPVENVFKLKGVTPAQWFVRRSLRD